MPELLSFGLLGLSAIFFVVDPMAVIPIFLAMTASDSAAKRRSMALRASLVALGLLTFFALFGTLVFKLFGITLYAFKVAGGLLLLITSVDMLRAQPPRTRSSPEETDEGTAKDDVAIVPLAMPLLAGPGAIATAMMLAGRAASWPYTVAVVLAIVLTCGTTYLLLRAAEPIQKLLSPSGIKVIERIMGLLLAAIAVQFIADGVAEFLRTTGQAS